jgi:hypothetical protein
MNITAGNMNRLNKFNFSILILLFIFLINCRISIPPVTLTGSKTATERQIVGEEKYIEKDAWLIASARTIKSKEKKEQTLTKKELEKKKRLQIRLYRALRTFDFFENEIFRYRTDSVIGENNEGFIVNLLQYEPKNKRDKPPQIQIKPDKLEKYTEKEKLKLEEFIKKNNAARKDLFDFAAKNLDPKLDSKKKKVEINTIRINLRKKFLSELSRGHWYQKKAGTWNQISTDEQFELE